MKLEFMSRAEIFYLALMDYHRLRRLVACAKSQEERLFTNGKIGENVGYDTSDPFLNDTRSDEKLQLGSPVVLIGTGEICTYVESVAENLHNICQGNTRRLLLSDSASSFFVWNPPVWKQQLEKSCFSSTCSIFSVSNNYPHYVLFRHFIFFSDTSLGLDPGT